MALMMRQWRTSPGQDTSAWARDMPYLHVSQYTGAEQPWIHVVTYLCIFSGGCTHLAKPEQQQKGRRICAGQGKRNARSAGPVASAPPEKLFKAGRCGAHVAAETSAEPNNDREECWRTGAAQRAGATMKASMTARLSHRVGDARPDFQLDGPRTWQLNRWADVRRAESGSRETSATSVEHALITATSSARREKRSPSMHQEDPHMYAEATRPERTARAGALMSGRNRKSTATPCAGGTGMRLLSDAAEKRGDICRRPLATPATGARTAPRHACTRAELGGGRWAICSPSELEACIASLPGPHVVKVYDGHGAAWW
jgi:hypothetical protein